MKDGAFISYLWTSPYLKFEIYIVISKVKQFFSRLTGVYIEKGEEIG
ncbi:MAG: hypothetical protein N2511_01535 [Thermodesulfovibrionales bacterium]|nr:hypothetical protein [Thermodesulfovibrionales bacterium]